VKEERSWRSSRRRDSGTDLQQQDLSPPPGRNRLARGD
jgi:hypothetical protein